MGIVNKIFGEKKVTSATDKSYIDLEEYVEKTSQEKGHANMYVRVGEIQRYEDLKTMTDYVCGGNILILDFSPLAEEEVILKRITNEIKKMVSDIDGDVVGIGRNLMIITPTGVKVDRRKLRGEFS